MGGIGSGPRKVYPGSKAGNAKLKRCLPFAWTVLQRTLASAASDDQIPPAATLGMAQWVIEQDIGKPTQKLDAQMHVQVGPDEYMRALQQAQVSSRMLPVSHNTASASSPERALSVGDVAQVEVGWVDAAPIRNVSQPGEILKENEDQLYINGEGI